MIVIAVLSKYRIRWCCLALWFFSVSWASADLIIVRNFAGGTAPSNAVGGGNLTDVFNAAADWWEMSILDMHTLSLDYSWGALPSSTLGQATVTTSPVPFTSASIVFDNDASSVFFLDPTPHGNSEWNTFTESTAELGGGTVNVGRVFTDATGDAAGRFDLLTIAKHEIGHALGLLDIPLPDPLMISAPLPSPGTVIQTVTTGGGHIDPVVHPAALMVPVLTAGQRKLQSGIDILATAENVGFTNVNTNPTHVPEPSPVYAFSAICFCLTGWFVWKKKKSL